jgi:osmotically-inducible protein OsmY
MKALFCFLLGVAAGAFGLHLYQQRQTAPSPSTTLPEAPARRPSPAPSPTPTPEAPLRERVEQRARQVGEQTRELARDTREAVGEKLRDWHLTPDDLREDLRRGRDIVRTRARDAGERFSDARIVTVVKAKLVLDRELSARAIAVSVDNGDVTLTGEVAAPDLVGRAIALALDTEGVLTVTSRLRVAAAP